MTVVVGVENVNLLLADELADISAATIGNMARHVDMLFRVMDLEKAR